jgi:hypothetical protein
MTFRLIKQPPTVMSGRKSICREQWLNQLPTTIAGQRIIRAAIEEFASHGIAPDCIHQIAKRAGTSRSTFYRYFHGYREAALFIISEYYWAPLNLYLGYLVHQTSSNTAQQFDSVLQMVTQPPGSKPSHSQSVESMIFKVVLSQMYNPDLLPESVLDNEYLGFIDKFSKIIEKGQKEGLFLSTLRPTTMAELLVFTLQGLIIQNGNRLQSGDCQIEEIKQIGRLLLEMGPLPRSYRHQTTK